MCRSWVYVRVLYGPCPCHTTQAPRVAEPKEPEPDAKAGRKKEKQAKAQAFKQKMEAAPAVPAASPHHIVDHGLEAHDLAAALSASLAVADEPSAAEISVQAVTGCTVRAELARAFVSCCG